MALSGFSEASENLVLHSPCAETTRQLGAALGRALSRPVTIGLRGTLGCGKTVFVQGLAQGLDVPPEYYVTSPTFTLINEYPGRLPLYHVDLYRLEDIDDLDDIGLTEVLSGEGVVAVEWAEKLPPSAHPPELTIRMEIIDAKRRRVELIAYGQAGCSLLRAVESIKYA